jgi:peptidoglycan/xylan/chitin deacetylase (PgdA/CDA1 family)
MQMQRLALIGVLALVLSACGGVRGGESVGSPTRSDLVEKPSFSVAPGRYSLPQSVAISSDIPAAVVYFTTDGSDPTTSSRVYGGPILIDATITLKAVVMTNENFASNVVTASYSIDASHESVSGLPMPEGLHTSEGLHTGSPTGNWFRVLRWAGFHSAITYSFDDGFLQQIADYPQLQATNTRMTFYLICKSERDPTTWAQAVKDGNELGNHTVHHCLSNGTCLSGTWSGSVQAEYDECTEYLKEKYGLANVWTTAAPFGDRGYEPVAKTRFFLNRGTLQGQIGPDTGSDPFYLRAYVARAGDDVSVFKHLIDRAEQKRRWQIFVFHALDQGYAWVKVEDLVASIDYAKSKGDVWIDSVVNVGAYWIGQEAVTNGKRTRTKDGLIVTWTLPSHFPPGKFVRVVTSLGTLTQDGIKVPRNQAGYYEVALDPGNLAVSP